MRRCSHPVQQSYTDTCSECHGSRWIFYEKEIEGIYSQPTRMKFCKPCPRCTGRVYRDNTGIPSQFHDADLTHVDWNCYGENMDERRKVAESMAFSPEKWEKASRGLFIWSGTPGSGKTFIASAIGNHIAARGTDVRFITEIGYLNMIKKGFKSAPGELNTARDYEKYVNCSLLIFDDLGVAKVSDWANEVIFDLINTRLNEGKTTIFTSNLAPEHLKYSSRTIDRIIKMSVVLRLPEISIRSKKAAAEQKDFLQKILV